MFGSGMRTSDLAKQTTLIISNQEMNYLMKIIKSLVESGLLTKIISETIKNEAKEQNRGVLGVLLATLGASLVGDLLRGKSTIRTGKRTVRAGHHC